MTVELIIQVGLGCIVQRTCQTARKERNYPFLSHSWETPLKVVIGFVTKDRTYENDSSWELIRPISFSYARVMLISSLFLDTLVCWNPKFLLGDKGCSSLNPQLCNFITVKVHLTPKYFFRSNKSLHLFETHCAFLPRFNPNLDLFQAVKVTKAGHYLLHDRALK